MVAPPEPREPSSSPERDVATLRKQGALAGIFGAVLLAGWFLYLDVVRGRPFFTPTFLATALLRGDAAPDMAETLEPSLVATLLFTVLHTAVFVAVGVGAAELLHRFVRVRGRALIALLLFGVLCVGFFVVAVNFSAVGPGAIALRDALIGNAIAAFAMAAYLARNLPPRI